MRLVLDTNVVASGLLWNGAPAQLLDAARVGEVELFTSTRLLAELVSLAQSLAPLVVWFQSTCSTPTPRRRGGATPVRSRCFSRRSAFSVRSRASQAPRSTCSFSPSALMTFMTVANSGLPSADSAL